MSIENMVTSVMLRIPGHHLVSTNAGACKFSCPHCGKSGARFWVSLTSNRVGCHTGDCHYRNEKYSLEEYVSTCPTIEPRLRVELLSEVQNGLVFSWLSETEEEEVDCLSWTSNPELNPHVTTDDRVLKFSVNWSDTDALAPGITFQRVKYETALRYPNSRGWGKKALQAFNVGVDRLNGDLVYPITNADRTIGVCRRPPGPGTYVAYGCHVTPKTYGYRKVSLSFHDGLFKPEHMIGDIGYIVEGQGDALKLYTLGLEATVGYQGGGGLSQPQARTLTKFEPRKFVLMPDMDEAGFKGVLKSAENIKAAFRGNVEILVVPFLGGAEDPGELDLQQLSAVTGSKFPKILNPMSYDLFKATYNRVTEMAISETKKRRSV